jgi:hypothetical protein
VRDLLVITPTRGRPAAALRLAGAVAATATAQTDLIVGIDDDDRSYDDVNLPCMIRRGPRLSCGGWTNLLAAEHAARYRAVASLGDDHLPVTPGWDRILLTALDELGGTGIAYGDDGLQHAYLPTAPVISSNIVQALGWMFWPEIVHVFCDNIWLDLAREAGCLAYRDSVTIRHLHVTAGLSPYDQTYADRVPFWQQDEAAYHAWRREHMADDVATVRGLMGG